MIFFGVLVTCFLVGGFIVGAFIASKARSRGTLGELGGPGKILLAISGILWVLASVLFAACVHCAVCAPIPANAIYDWIDNIITWV